MPSLSFRATKAGIIGASRFGRCGNSMATRMRDSGRKSRSARMKAPLTLILESRPVRTINGCPVIRTGMSTPTLSPHRCSIGRSSHEDRDALNRANCANSNRFVLRLKAPAAARLIGRGPDRKPDNPIPASKAARDVPDHALDLVETVGPYAVNIRGQHMIAGNVLGIAEIHAQIPLRQNAAPLGSDAAIDAVRGGREI